MRTIKHNLLLIAVLFAMIACKTQTYVPHNDSVRVEYRYDSVYVWQYDSIYVDRYTKADTVWLTTTKYKTVYQDKVKIEKDTIYQDKVVVQTEKYIPDFYKNCTIALWVLVVLVLLYIAWKVIKKIYLK